MLSKDSFNKHKQTEKNTINKTLGANIYRGSSQFAGGSDFGSVDHSLKADTEAKKMSKTMNCNISPEEKFPSNLKKLLEDPKNFEAFFNGSRGGQTDFPKHFGMDFQKNIFKRKKI